jgi:CxxC-x17-CxxC domain-containing protein
VTEPTNFTCVECGASFSFTDEEQAFYNERQFAPPKRCLDCRRKRRAEKRQRGPRPGGGGGGGGGGRPRGGFSRPFGDRGPGGGGGGRRYEIVCDACGETASVPFEPSPGRPVYCLPCFRSRR